MGILCKFLLYINIYMGIIMGMFLYNMGRMGFYQWDFIEFHEVLGFWDF